MQPCGPILKSYLSFPIKLRIGIISAFATITVHCFITSCFVFIHKPQHNFGSQAETVLRVAGGSHRSVSGAGAGGLLEEASSRKHCGRLQQSEIPTQTVPQLTSDPTAARPFNPSDRTVKAARPPDRTEETEGALPESERTTGGHL